MRRLSLENIVGVAWIVTLLTFLVLLAIYLTDLPAVVRLLCLVVIPAGCLAFPIAVIGSLLLAFRQLGQPRKEDAADYDDELKTEPTMEPDSRQ